MITKTYIAKAIEATKNQSTQQVRGLLDQSSKNVIVDRQILARIVRSCVSEARPFSLRELERLIPGDIKVSSAPVFRDDGGGSGRSGSSPPGEY